MKIFFGLILMLLVISIPVFTQTSAGDVWFVPASSQVMIGTGFTTEVHTNTGLQNLSAYGFDVTFDQTIITPNTALGNSSVEPGSEGFVSAVNPNTPGLLVISGFDAMGKGPGADLHVVTINWNADSLGITTLGNTVNDFVDPTIVVIGTPNGIAGSVEVVDAAYTVGDVNEDGSINITDALIVAQYYVGLNPPQFTAPLEAGDANADGNTNIVDAMLIAQYYVGLITELPWPPTGDTPTPTPVDTPTPETPTCDYTGVWGTYVDPFGSTVDPPEGADALVDCVASATFVMMVEPTPDGDYPYAGLFYNPDPLGAMISISLPVTFTYRSTGNIRFTIAQEVLKDNGEAWGYDLPSVADWTEITLDEADLAQPSWVATPTPLDLNAVYQIKWEPKMGAAGGSATIDVRDLLLTVVTGETPTPTPVTQTPVPGTDLRIQYRCANTEQYTNQINVNFVLVNAGSSAITLSDCSVYYYYIKEGTVVEEVQVTYVQTGSGTVNVTLNTAQENAVATFNSSAGNLSAGGQVEVQYYIHKTDWSNYDQGNDASWDSTYSSYADYRRMTLVYQGTAVWGPGVPDITPTPSPIPATPTPTCDGTCPPPPAGILLEAEDYSRASDNDAANQGLRGDRTDGVDFEDNWQGLFNTGWVSGGEWLEWDVDISTAGDYTVWVRAAHDDSGTLTGEVVVNSVLVGPVNVPNTDPYGVAHPPGHWQNWENIEIGSITLDAGINVVRLVHTGVMGSFNVDYVYLNGESGPPPMPTSVPQPGGYESPLDRHGKLQVIGTDICNSSGTPIQLRGVSSHDLRWHWISAKHTIQNLAYTQGCELFRLVIYSDPNNYGYAAAGHKEVLRERLYAYLDDAVESGIYAMVDWHVLKDNDPNKHIDVALEFFEEFSAAYSSNDNIIWEICNEPNGPGWPQIKSYAEQVIPVIRQNSDGIIVVGTPNYSSEPNVASQDPLSGSNIMYTLHFYAGTHGDSYKVNAETAMTNGCAVFITEWGTTASSGTGASDLVASEGWVDWMALNNLSWCNWSFCNKDEGCSILSVPAGFAGPWNVSDFTTNGAWIMERL